VAARHRRAPGRLLDPHGDSGDKIDDRTGVGWPRQQPRTERGLQAVHAAFDKEGFPLIGEPSSILY